MAEPTHFPDAMDMPDALESSDTMDRDAPIPPRRSPPNRLAASALLVVVGLAGASCVPGEAWANDKVYRYRDADGVMVISNVAPGRNRGLRMKKKGDLIEVSSVQASPVRRGNPNDYMHILEEACALYKIPKALALAVMATESNFDPQAVSHAGASGLMQLMPKTAAEMYVKDIFDPRENIHGGVRYLRVLANMFDGDMVKIVAAYNAGPDAVKRAGGAIPNITETQNYVRKVIQRYFAYKEQLGPDS